MNFLFLATHAPRYKYFFSALGALLEDNGHRVRFAVDSRYSAVIEPDEFADSRADFFSSYFRETWPTLSEQPSGPGPGKPDCWQAWLFPDYDRFRWGHFPQLRRGPEYWRKLYAALNAFFDELIERHGIDVVVYENVSDAFSYTAYYAAQRRSRRYIGISSSRLPGRCELHTTVLDESARVRRWMCRDDLLTDENRAWLRTFAQDVADRQPDYMRGNRLAQLSVTKKYLRREMGTRLWRHLRAGLRHRSELYYSFLRRPTWHVVYWAILRSVARRLRGWTVRRYLADSAPSGRYYLYPVHFHPEASTSVLAPDFCDELANIRNIAFSLPSDTLLVVKDHISAYAWQPDGFYHAVAEIPNVVLLGPDANTRRLIEGAEGVVTITSTVGFEAYALRKRVICFGDVFYSGFPGVQKVSSFGELRSVLRTPAPEVSDEDSARAIIGYREYTYPAPLHPSYPWDADNLQALAGWICELARENAGVIRDNVELDP